MLRLEADMFGLMLYKYNVAQQILIAYWTNAKRKLTTKVFFAQSTDVW